MLTKKNRVWAIIVLIAATMGLTSCLKNNIDTTPTRPRYWMYVLNASTFSTGIDFYDNGIKGNTNGAFNFDNKSTYSGYGGEHTYKINAYGKDSTLTSSTKQLDSTSYYTFLIFDATDNTVRSSFVYNDLSTCSPTAINFRFFNLSKSLGPVDVYLGSQKILSSQTFNNGYFEPTFQQLSNISDPSSMSIKLAGTDSVVAKNTNLFFSIGTGGVYTAYISGTPNSTGTDKLVCNTIPGYLNNY
ncbi:DUF4397 domain-containing protein [Chitinophaga sp. Cy-1792]|uniref:DUF4397 domain-containing protein n=1 Tax=Chitinophaga sp. Cy-1792 TaxID=2608339 RepID=UPI00141F0A5E|nr:DUF4397 domain-containing protein [Chitinophaga sp. Cy-1792]NIG57669.1 DUF4397 domain-containing protein [Chitinophaga sp. Cy-1792]